MPKFRKKPVIIEAIQYLGDVESIREILNFTNYEATPKLDDKLYVYTLEGEMVADPTDWIIKGIAGEFYPCKNSIFEKTYEEVDG